ncbi:hypothetical protein HYU07_03940 [Candidatus Woesearchaeota archaeon]|nr:hypothetical protein [Candidatus Woesearchaeota archaeon]
MRRKVIKQRDSYTITLPIKWAKEKGISEEVDIEETQNNLLIRPISNGYEKKSITFTLDSSFSPFVTHVITNLYRLGFDSINLNIKNKEQVNIIQETLDKYTIGFEITRHDDKICVLESISEPTEEKSETILRRIFLLIKETLDALAKHITEHKPLDINILKANAMKVDKYSYFSRRTIIKHNFAEKSVFNYVIFYQLMLIEHSLLRIAHALAEDKKISKEFIEIIEKAQPYFDNFYQGYFEKNLEKLHIANRAGQELLYAGIYGILRKKKGDIAVYHLAEFIRLVYLSISPTVGIIIDAMTKKEKELK